MRGVFLPLAVCGLLAALAAPASFAKPAAITDVHYYSSSRSTSIIVEMETAVQPHVQHLANPPRVVIDLRDVRIHLPGKGTRTFVVKDGLVRQVRVAQYTPKDARVVVELEHDANVRITPHKKPQRLNILVRLKSPHSDEEPLPDDDDAPKAPKSPAVGQRSLTPSSTVPAKSQAPVASPASRPPSGQTAPAAGQGTPLPASSAPPAVDTPVPSSAAPTRTPPPAAPPVKPEPAKQEPAKQEPATPEPGPGDKLEKFLKNPPPPSKEPSTTRPEQMAAASGAGPRPLPASANASGNRSLTRALGLKLARVVIDAGHGGHDEGTRGPTGLLEKDLVLDVALRLGTLVEQRLGAEVVYTRSTDVFVPLEERTAIANRLGADLFLSIHANSSPIKSISGSEVYFLSFATSKEALDLAGGENAGTNRSIHELQDLLKKIALNEKVTESQEFGARVQRELYTAWNRMSGVSRNRGVKKAPFVVLIGAQMPSVLAEIGFVSNPRDEGLLKRADQRQRLAEALYRGVNAYASTLSHMEAAPKPASRAAR